MTRSVGLIVIPARYGSSRLPGKPLLRIAGRTLLERVVGVARQAAAANRGVEIVVATDDDAIEAHAKKIGCIVVRTSSDIQSGSGRCYAAARVLSVRPDIVLNLQGDAPFVPPRVVAAMIEAAHISRAAVVTPVVQLDWAALDRLRDHKMVAPFSGTTCIRRADGAAIWFSKAILPVIRNEAVLRASHPLSPVFRHLGVYAYRYDALERFEAIDPTPYETHEGLEQLRFLETGMQIQTIAVSAPLHAMSGIDTMDDIVLAESLIERFGDPHIAW